MRKNNVLNSILVKIEGDQEILRFADPEYGLLLWPFLRHQVLFHLTFTKLNLNSVGSGHTASSWEKIKSVIFAIAKNPFWLAGNKKRIWIFNSGVTNIKEGEVYVNRLADYFYNQYPTETALLEETASGKHMLPRAHPAVYSHLFIRLLAKMLSPFFLPKKKRIKAELPALRVTLERKLKDEETNLDFLPSLLDELSMKWGEILAEYVIYRWLFSVGRPQLLLVEDASYGSKAHLIVAAKNQGISVAEIQHGTINESHLAYNFGNAVPGSVYTHYLPDYFLAYGRLWSEMINLPVTKINVGNPHLSESIQKTKSVIRQQVILVLGSGTDPASLTKIVLTLHQRYHPMGYRVIFRPHPLERATIELNYPSLIKNNISIDSSPNMYNSFQNAEVVVSEYSTSIYEAAAFGLKVFLIRNSLSESFGDANMERFPVLDNLENQDLLANTDDFSFGTALWEPDWKKKYKMFVDSVIR